MDEPELESLLSLATFFSRDFERCFIHENRINIDYVDSNADLFYSRYSALVNAFYDCRESERSGESVRRSRVIFVSIFFTWLRVKLFSLRCAWMRDSFLPFYDREDYDLQFWECLVEK